MLGNCERGQWAVMGKVGGTWGRTGLGTRWIFASVTRGSCGWHHSLLFIASRLHTSTSDVPDTSTVTEVGKSTVQYAWAWRFLILCFITEGEVTYWGFSHELLIIQKPAILCMRRCSYAMSMIWLRNTFIEITVFLFLSHLWQVLC